MTRYPTLDELVYINEQIPTINTIHKHLQGLQRVRDMALLSAAVHRPQHSVFGQDAYPTLAEKAAALLHAVARNHPFADGNKRSATLAMLFMLEVNGQRVVWQPPEALERILALAEGRQNIVDFANWLPLEPCQPRPVPHANADEAHIARLIAEHRWLLDELAQR
ncbi:MAG: type II toxin-antitoxin system death-on-curing family toxin [Anaerolineae bacterium]|nr:type II toxin-antitoxin system death-on-curing family toxin [Anaerolineae bacterium]MDW8173370.1 type II toxin-antitoxin system death-on-curing family toxin [Anaerolineae bacterium]